MSGNEILARELRCVLYNRKADFQKVSASEALEVAKKTALEQLRKR